MKTVSSKTKPRTKKSKVLEKTFKAPAMLLEEGIEFAKKEEKELLSKKPFKLAEEYWNTLGPGLTTGASDDDPAGIATYSQAGAQYGFQLAWMSWFTFPLMAVVQEMCARIGIVTGHGLAANIRRRYSKKVLYTITGMLFFANTFNIGADLGMMAQAVQLMVPNLNFILIICAFAVGMLLLQIFTTYARYSKYLKYLAFVLLAYVASAVLSRLDWGTAWHAVTHPSISLSKDQLFLICAILGTTISPYLFFWQTSQEVEEENLQGKEDMKSFHQKVAPHHLHRASADVWSGMFFSNVVMFFIIAACAGTLFAGGVTNITSAADAALALRPFAGDAAFFLFMIGIIGTGMLAIPVLAGSTSYAISESFGWKHGLYRKLKEAYAFYGVIIVSMVLGILFNLIGIDPVKALIWSAVLNGLMAPFILFFIIRMSGSKKVMGKHVSGIAHVGLGWFTLVLMALSGIAAIVSLFL